MLNSIEEQSVEERIEYKKYLLQEQMYPDYMLDREYRLYSISVHRGSNQHIVLR